MKVRKLGLDWGAAFAEAEPIEITHADSPKVQVYVSESHGLVVDLIPSEWSGSGLIIHQKPGGGYSIRLG